jgi:hypothetical protein
VPKDYTAELKAQSERKAEEAHAVDTFTHHFDSYTPHDKATLHQWTTNSEAIKNNDQGKRDHMDQIIQKHTTPIKAIVWSKTLNDPRKKANAEGIVEHPRHMSTSLHKNAATDYLKDRNAVHEFDKDHNVIASHHHVLKVSVPAGINAAFIHDENSINPKYKEVVLPRDKKLKYLHTETSTNGSRHEHIHHMELIK